MAKYFNLLVKSKEQETADCISLTLEVPPELTEQFQFQQGQHLALKKIIDGESTSRSYSICSSPLEGNLKVAIKKVPNGKFSTYAVEELYPGDNIEVMPPAGHFNTALDAKNEKHYLSVTAGSGITPIISIIKATLATEPKSSFTLLYGNRDTESIIFQEELEGIKNRYLNRFSIHHFFTREKMANKLFSGRINGEKLKELQNLIDYTSIDDFFICGPEEMMAEAVHTFEAMGINKEKIHLELFTSPVGKLGQSRPERSESPMTVDSTVAVIMDGIKYEFPVKSDVSILEMANKKGADLPFSCKGGVCSTCKAKIVEGEVEMETNYALEPEEIKAGYVLTCQARPLSEKVVITFDEA